MILVVLTHVSIIVFNAENEATFHFYLKQFRMPLFFFVSGYLLYKKYLQPRVIDNFSFPIYWNCIKTCICRIIIPSIIFSSIVYAPQALFHNQEIDFYQFRLNTIGGG